MVETFLQTELVFTGTWNIFSALNETLWYFILLVIGPNTCSIIKWKWICIYFYPFSDIDLQITLTSRFLRDRFMHVVLRKLKNQRTVQIYSTVYKENFNIVKSKSSIYQSSFFKGWKGVTRTRELLLEVDLTVPNDNLCKFQPDFPHWHSSLLKSCIIYLISLGDGDSFQFHSRRWMA